MVACLIHAYRDGVERSNCNKAIEFEMSGTETIQVDVKDRILSCANLPALPNVAVNVLERLKNESTSPSEITELIECEPAICTRVLSLANSPLYGLSRPVSTLSHAIVLLGIPAVCQLAVSISTKEVFCSGSGRVLKKRKKIYEQSLACATNARILANQFDLPSPDETFLSAMMQNIGQLVFLAELGDSYCDFLDSCPSGETTEEETNWIGIGHDSLGEACGRRWGLPVAINQAIVEHHSPYSETMQPIAKTLLAANYFSRSWHIAFDSDEELVQSELIESQFESSQLCEVEAMCKESFDAVKAICI